MTRDDILAALPKLTRNDLLALQGVILSLLGASKPDDLSHPSLKLYSALTAICGASVPYATFLLSNHGKLFKKNTPAVMEFIAATFPNLKTKVEEQAVMRLVLGLVVDDLAARLRAKPSMGMVASNLPRIPELFENAYPGYLESGLAHLIADKICGGK